MLRQIRPLSLIALALAACTKEPAPTPEKKPVAEKGPAYELSLAASGPWAAGKDSNATVTVTAKPGFHVNPEYPVTFKPEGFDAVKFAGERVALTPGTKTPCADKAEDACKVEFALAVTPEKAGPAKVAGIVAFSVCSTDKCLIEKVPVTLAIAVQ